MENGSQSKPVVLASTLFVALLSGLCIYLLARGPDRNSVFWVFQYPLTFYPLSALGAGFFSSIAFVGLQRFRSME